MPIEGKRRTGMKKSHLLMIVLLLFLFFFVSFSSSDTGAQDISGLLNKTYDLSLKGKEGDIDYYRMKTVYYHGNNLGFIQGKEEILGSFKREVLKAGPDALVVRYTWKDVRAGSSPQPYAEIATWKPYTFAEGFSYELNFMAPENFLAPVDVKNIPKTMEGMRFWVKIMDAHSQFELLRTEKNGNINRLSKIGSRVESPDAHQSGGWDLPPFITESKFANGDYETHFVGLGLIDGRACAILEYINADSTLSSKMQTSPQYVFDQQGSSNFWGHIYVDLETGKLIKGDLFEYVLSRIESSAASFKPMIVFERRYLEIEKIMEDEY
jgi:hypothetical protein